MTITIQDRGESWTESKDLSSVILSFEEPSLSLPNGIDVRIALDMVRMARQNLYDVAVIFSQDQDLSEVATEVREISNSQDRWIKVACAFPQSPSFNQRGINGTDWIRIDRLDYDKCLDPTDYC